MKVTACFVSDPVHPKLSDLSRLLVKSIKLYQPDWQLASGVVGEPPKWLEELGVRAFPIEPPDPELRYVNKLATMAAVEAMEGYKLFLDGDVLMCRPLDVELSEPLAGVHADYPHPSTYDGHVKAVRVACGMRFPPTYQDTTGRRRIHAKVKCTMYGDETWPSINVGVVFIRHDIAAKLIQLWLDFYWRAKAKLDEGCKTFSEQMALMPTLDKLGLDYRLLDARYNWNGTIYPAPADVVFLHYHRPDVLSSDAQAMRVLKEIGAPS